MEPAVLLVGTGVVAACTVAATACARRRIDLQKNRRFMSALTHELKTPLAILRSHWESQITNEALPLAIRQRFVADVEELSRLNRLVNDYLQMIRLETHEFRLDKKRVNVTEVLLEIADLLEGLAAEKGCRIKLIAARDFYTVADRSLFVQAVLNLVENGLKYTAPDSSVTIRVDRDDRVLLLSIEDEGPGIPPDALDSVFDLFFRVGNSEAHGSGIGLSVVKSIVDAHGWRIDVRNQDEGGCRFELTMKDAQ